MSLFSVQARKHTTYYDHLVSTSRTPGRERPADRKATEGTTQGKGERTSGESVCDDSRSSDKSRSINRTYVISAMSKSGGGGDGPHTPYRGRLTLQRRSRRKTGAEAADKTVSDSSHNCTPAAPEKRLTLQRRTRTPSMGKGMGRQREVSGTDPQQTPKVLSEPNGRTPVLIRSMSLKSESRGKDKDATSQGKPARSKTPSRCPSAAQARQLLEEQAQTFKTPTKKTPFEKIAAKRDVFERLAKKEAHRPAVVRSASLQRGAKPRLQQEDKTPAPVPRTNKAACAGVQRPQVAKTSTSTSSGLKVEATQASSRTSNQGPPHTEQQTTRATEALKLHDSFKMENSAVTVAVRVRPFNARLVTTRGFGCVALQRGKH